MSLSIFQGVVYPIYTKPRVFIDENPPKPKKNPRTMRIGGFDIRFETWQLISWRTEMHDERP